MVRAIARDMNATYQPYHWEYYWTRDDRQSSRIHLTVVNSQRVVHAWEASAREQGERWGHTRVL